MKMTAYKLFDGEFFRRLLSDCSAELGVDLWPHFQWKGIAGSGRAFFYDALPVKKDQQSETEFAKEYDERVADLDRLRRIPNVFVKDGLGRYRSSKRSREQKGVDVLLAIDAVIFALRGVADELHIYTGDLDFFPVFEALQATSCRGRLFYEDGKEPADLVPYADSAEPISLEWLLGHCGMGWGHANSVFPPNSEPISKAPPTISGVSIHGGEFDLIFDPDDRIFEVRYVINGHMQCSRTDRWMIAYGIAQRFMRDPPGDLRTRVKAESAR